MRSFGRRAVGAAVGGALLVGALAPAPAMAYSAGIGRSFAPPMPCAKTILSTLRESSAAPCQNPMTDKASSTRHPWRGPRTDEEGVR